MDPRLCVSTCMAIASYRGCRKEERLRARQDANLAEMEHAHAQLMASLREMAEDLSLAGKSAARSPISSGEAAF